MGGWAIRKQKPRIWDSGSHLIVGLDCLFRTSPDCPKASFHGSLLPRRHLQGWSLACGGCTQSAATSQIHFGRDEATLAVFSRRGSFRERKMEGKLGTGRWNSTANKFDPHLPEFKGEMTVHYSLEGLIFSSPLSGQPIRTLAAPN